MEARTDIDEVVVGEMILTFDGRILEIFNGSEGDLRLHVGRMKAKVGPTRKNRLYVELSARRRNTPREIFEVSEEERPAFEALFARVEAAMGAAAGEPGGYSA